MSSRGRSRDGGQSTYGFPVYCTKKKPSTGQGEEKKIRDKGPDFPTLDEIFADHLHHLEVTPSPPAGLRKQVRRVLRAGQEPRLPHSDHLEVYKSMIGNDGWCTNYDKPTRTCNIYQD